MKTRTRIKTTLPILWIALCCCLAACDTGKRGTRLVVIYSEPGVQLLRGTQDVPLRTGLLLRSGDTLLTNKGTVDLQSNTGVTVRIRKYTRVRIDSLLSGVRGKLSLNLSRGGLIARAQTTGQERPDFQITTPTAVASVRGTAFSVEVEEAGRRPRVKVLEGTVAMRPRVPSLERIAPEEVRRSPALSDLTRKLEAQERLLEPATAATLDQEAETEVLSLETRLATEREAGRSAADLSIPETREVISEKRNIVLERSDITPREEAEVKTLIAVEVDLIESTPEADDDDDRARRIDESYRTKMEEALKEVERRAREKELRTEQELKKHYRLLEIVHLNDGSRLRGAIVTHTGSTMIMHTLDGVRRLDESEVNFVRYRAQ